MSANPLELFTAYAGLSKPTNLEPPFHVERRKRVRTRVHWRVLLFRNQSDAAVESLTLDLSSGGFYCLCMAAFTVGELVACNLKVPTYAPGGREAEQHLECKVRVTRVEPDAAEGLFGIACCIEDYHFAHADATHA